MSLTRYWTDLYVKNPPMIVMGFMEGGTLEDLLEDDLLVEEKHSEGVR